MPSKSGLIAANERLRGEVKRLRELMVEFTVSVRCEGGDTIVALRGATLGGTLHEENLREGPTAAQIAKSIERVKAVAPVIAGDRACVVTVR